MNKIIKEFFYPLEEVLSEKPLNRLENEGLNGMGTKKTKSNDENKPEIEIKTVSPVLEKASKSIWVQKARSIAQSCTTLEELKAQMEAFEGCLLKDTATQMVFSDGVPFSKVMLIGEAPGAEEDKQGKPFVGMSGQLLSKMIAWIGLNREENIYIANTVPWRPPANRQPTTQEIEMCLPFLEKHIELINPTCIVLLGGVSAKALLNTKESMVRLRGKFHEITLSSGFKVNAMVLFHPAYLLRSPSQKKFVWQDLLTLKAYLKETKIHA